MSVKTRRRRDPTFLYLACIAGLGGLAAIGTSLWATVRTMHGAHPTSTYFFFSLWGLAALAGAAANVATYFQTGDPPEKPPRGGVGLKAPIVLDAHRRPARESQDREAA